MGHARWIDSLDPDQPVTEAAASVVLMRLAEVQERLARLADDEGDPVRNVHQLRVATRRADTALAAFRGWFRRKRAKRVRGVLRELRRAAAAARVADVQRLRLEACAASPEDPVRRRAAQAGLAAIARDRREAGLALDEVVTPKAIRLLERSGLKLVRRLRDGDDAAPPPLRVAAGDAIVAAVDRMRRAATDDLARIEALHELRLRAKRVRYAIELFSVCFEASLRSQLHPEVKAIQDRLGEMNDAHEMSVRLRSAADEAEAAGDADDAAALRVLADDEADAAERVRAAFIDWWHRDGHRERLLGALDRAAGAGSR